MIPIPLCALCILCASLAACGDTPTGPSSGPIRVTASIDRAVIGRNDTATLTYRAENISTETMTLTFPSSCLVRISFVNVGTDQVTPAPVACLTVITRRTIAPGDVLTSAFRLQGPNGMDSSAISLPSGRYRASGVLDSGSVEGPPVNFVVN
jgi:hypothetical protein